MLAPFKPYMILLVCYCWLVQWGSAQETCNLDGVIFQAGESIGDKLTTRCGPPDEFPCFCKPGSEPPIDCPYCGIPTIDNEEGLVCAVADGPTIYLTGLEGIRQECFCRRTVSGTPQTFCVDAPDSTISPETPQAPPTGPPAEVCTLEWSDGAVDVYQDGESYGDLFSTRCGPPEEFPCFCDTSKEDKINCPYCGVPTNTGGLACGRVDETFVLIDEFDREISCYCNEAVQSQCQPTATNPTKAPSIAPFTAAPTTAAPTLRPTEAPETSAPTPFPRVVTPQPTDGSSNDTNPPTTEKPTDRPTLQPTIPPTRMPSVSPTIAPQPVPTNPRPTVPVPTIDKPTLLLPSRTPPISTVVPGCSFEGIDGNEEFLLPGEIFPDGILDGPCAPRGGFPAFCNPDLPSQVEYPYCVFTMTGTLNTAEDPPLSSEVSISQIGTSDGSDLIVCARSGDRVTVPTLAGTVTTCSCLYVNPFIGPVSSCPNQMATVPLGLTESPTTSPTSSPTVLVASETPSSSPSEMSSSTSVQSSIQSSLLGLMVFSIWMIMVAS